jgi:hypothetical protein
MYDLHPMDLIPFISPCTRSVNRIIMTLHISFPTPILFMKTEKIFLCTNTSRRRKVFSMFEVLSCLFKILSNDDLIYHVDSVDSHVAVHQIEHVLPTTNAFDFFSFLVVVVPILRLVHIHCVMLLLFE